ncbi:MAG TPA: glycogen/starch/alpha-glucan phosphorylase [Xanthomonadales bacterium]|nr:glycogen/starch/alpha-glucan phosphorylase [Xanthomonadales bacterium]
MVPILQKEELKRRILERLVYSVGKDVGHASARDWCVAVTLAVRDKVVDNWMETTRRIYQEKRKRVYYLSMEFLIGRLLGDTLSNLGLTGLCRSAMSDLGVKLDDILFEEPDAALGNGGLGRLAACFMDSMATLGIAGFGYGIRYQHGLFRQRLGEGWQIEEAEDWLTQGGNPWEFERPEASYLISFGGAVAADGTNGDRWHPAEQVIACANDMPIAGWGAAHVNTLRLWSAKPARTFDLSRFNQGDYLQAAQHQVLAETLTRVLYPDDSTDKGRELRLKQEYFFTSASVQDLLHRFLLDHDQLETLHHYVAIQLNDTHPAIMVPELMRLLMDKHGFECRAAFELARQCISYTNHTLLPEALESWPLDLFARVLPRHLQLIREIDGYIAQEAHASATGIDAAKVLAIASNGDNGGVVRMGHLAFVGSHRVNGVSVLHTRLMTETVFENLHRLYPERIVNVTNGVTPRRWLHLCNPTLAGLISETIGEHWIADLERISQITPFADDAVFRQAFMGAKQLNKDRLAREIQKATGVSVDPLALFDVQIKRIHEYKRQLLNALQVLARYRAIVEDAAGDWQPVVKIFSGKAAPSYVMAKLIVKLINDIAQHVNNDPRVGDRLKVVYMPNYNVSLAEIIIPGADLSEQISTAGMEASGTGNMKLALNGALTLGTLDGANIEIRERVGEDNIFIFGLTAEGVSQRRRQGYDPAAIIEQNPVLAAVLAEIRSGVYSGGDTERFKPIIEHLYQHDYFMVAADFDAYCRAHGLVEKAFRQKDGWARSAVLNTAGVGWFSADRAIRSYDEQIWHSRLTPS